MQSIHVPDEQFISWLRFADVDAGLTRFVGDTYIVTDAFTYRSVGEPLSPVWEMEEWCLSSVLVPVKRLDEAGRSLTLHDLKIEPQWIDRHRFDFGESSEVKGIPIKECGRRRRNIREPFRARFHSRQQWDRGHPGADELPGYLDHRR
jgi:hypothetical protein